MAHLFQIERTDEFYDSLPPLVPKGASLEERDRILDEIVEAWATPLPEGIDLNEWDTVASVTLDRVVLWDAEREEPIDLRVLVRAVLDRVDCASDKQEKPTRAITLRGCRVTACDLSDVDFAGRNIRFQAVATSFGERASFGGASFGEGASFWAASFGKGAVFVGASFGERASFVDASFGERASFVGASFGEGAFFVGASIGVRAFFVDASFDERASFRGASFGEGASFRGASFGAGASFGFASFGAGASFEDAQLNGNVLRNVTLHESDLRIADGQGGWISTIERVLESPYSLFAPPPFILDNTGIRNTVIHSRSRDPWWVLRRTYTGTGMIFILFFTLAAFAVPAGRALFWGGVSAAQRHAAPTLLDSADRTHQLLAAAPGGAWDAWVAESQEALRSLRGPEPSAPTDAKRRVLEIEDVEHVYDLYIGSRVALESFREANPTPAETVRDALMELAQRSERAEMIAQSMERSGTFSLRERRVFGLVLGTERGWMWGGLSLILIAYGSVRAWMTYLIGPMRDHADQIGRTPAWDEYRLLWRVHRVLSVVLFIAFVKFALGLAELLWRPLLMPS